jgi:type I restriction enzyme, S subunit
MNLHIQPNWKIIQLGDIAEFRNGINYNKTNFGTGIKIIGVKDFQDHLYPEYSNLDEMNPKGIVRSDSVLKENDILFVRSNGNRQLIGRSLFIKGLNEQVTHSAFTIRARFISDSVLAKFCFYLFRTSLIRDIFSNQGSGTNISNLNQDILSKISVSLPPLPTQHKITTLLSVYDDLIENNTRRIKILEEIVQGIFREWFINFRFPGHEGVRMVESELGLIPEGWEVSTIGKISTVIPGYAFSSQDWCHEGIPIIKITNIQLGNLIDVNKVDHISEAMLSSKQEKYWISNGDFLIAMTGATAGKVGKLRSKERMLLNQRVAKIDAKTHYKEYLWCVISTPDAEKKFHALADGAAQANMSGTQIENTKLILPSFTVLKQFNEFVSPMLNSIDNFILQDQLLHRTRDLLLPKLISGEIDISGLDIRIPEAEA